MPNKPLKQFCDFSYDVCKTYGFSDVQAALVSEVWASPEPLTYADLAKQTGYSLATISTTISMLKPFDMVATERRPGSKKLYVTRGEDMVPRIQKKVEQVQQVEINPLKEKLPTWIRQAKKKEDRKYLQDLQKQIHTLDEIFKDIRKAFAKREQ